jgi:predicted nucleic acid-binding protein
MKDTPDKQILIDSDAFIGWLKPDDSLHEVVKVQFQKIKKDKLATVTTSLVVAETATTLSHKVSQDAAILFLDFVRRLPVIHITEELHAETVEVFKTLKKKRTSFVDCSNVVVMRAYKIPTIFSFDEVYHKKFGLQTVA